jgi:hypothetical protein
VSREADEEHDCASASPNGVRDRRRCCDAKRSHDRVNAKVTQGEARSLGWTYTDKAIPLSGVNARDASFDYLRAFIVLLVLLHHSALAYAVMWPAQPFGDLRSRQQDLV